MSRAALALAFLLTGASGLVFETLSGRLLGLALGATADTAALALASFMLALTLGSLAGGRLAQFGNPRNTAAVSQAALALATLAVPRVAQLAGEVTMGAPAGAGVHAAAALVVVGPPAFLMGLLLPLAAEGAVQLGHERGPLLAALYAASSAGGVLGVVLGQVVLAPALGTIGLLRCGAALELCAGAALFYALRGPCGTLEREPTTPVPVGSGAACLVALLAGSVVLFALEVLWIQVLSAVVGASVYANGWMLASVLGGLAIGAFHADAFTERALPWLYVALALAIGLTLPIWEHAGPFLVRAGARWSGFAAREGARLAFSALMVVGPAALCGTAFPLGLEQLARAGGSVGQGAAASAFGAALGSLVASAWLIPALGSERSLRVAGGAALAVAFLWARAVGRPTGLFIAASLAVAPLALLPSWNMDLIADGSALYFRRFQVGPVIWTGEDRVAGLVTVRGTAAERALFTNGKVQGDTGPLKAAQSRMVGYPLLGLQRFERALVIGVGTGYTTHLVASAPFKAVDALEVSPAVLRAARALFVDANQGVLSGSRVRVLEADGRHFLGSAGPDHDLISVQVSSLWDAASSALYTREFYARAAARLAPGGVLQQWVPLHHVTRRDLASLLATLQAELPHVTLWRFGSDGVALASARPQPLVDAALRLRDQDPRFAAFRAASGRTELRELLGDLVLASPGVARFAAEGSILTQENSALEWSAARSLSDDSLSEDAIAAWLEPYRTQEFKDWR